MNPINLPDELIDADVFCGCHGAWPCPEPVSVNLPAAELAELADLLAVVDEFLRSRSVVADLLADFYDRRGQTHPGFVANNLIDQVSFTAAALHRRVREHAAGTGPDGDGR